MKKMPTIGKVMTYLLCMLLVVVSTVQGDTIHAASTIASAETAQTGKKLAQIKERGKIILGTSADYPPYEFHETINGEDKIVGFDIQIGMQIAKDLGVELEIKDMSFDGLLAALQTGTIDMVIAGMSPTPERVKSVDFSVPYFLNRNLIVIREDDASKLKTVADFKGKIVGAQQGSLQEEDALTIDGAEVRAIGNVLNIVTELKQKSIDGMVVEEAIAESLLSQNENFTFIEVEEWNSNQLGSSVAIQKGNEDLLKQINITVERMLANEEVLLHYANAKDLAENGPSIENGYLSETDGAQEELSYFAKYAPMIVKGVLVTVGIAFFSVLFGSLLGLLIALAKTSSVTVLKWLASGYIEIVRGTPMLIQIYIIFYALPYIGIKLPPFYAGIIAVSLNSGAYVAEIFRAGINAVDKGQAEAGRSLGMSVSKVMKKIVVPQAVKNILPALGNEFVTIIKESSIVSIIGVGDLMYVANTIRGNTYQPFKPLIIATIIYFVLTFTLSKVVSMFERKLNKNVTNN